MAINLILQSGHSFHFLLIFFNCSFGLRKLLSFISTVRYESDRTMNSTWQHLIHQPSAGLRLRVGFESLHCLLIALLMTDFHICNFLVQNLSLIFVLEVRQFESMNAQIYIEKHLPPSYLIAGLQHFLHGFDHYLY